MRFTNLIDIHNFIRNTETVNAVNYPLAFNPATGQALNVPNDGLVLDPSLVALGNTQLANAGLAGSADSGKVITA